MKRLLREAFPSAWFYRWVAILVTLFVAGWAYPFLLPVAGAGLVLFLVLGIADLVILFRNKAPVTAERIVPERFSNGDPNPVRVRITNHFPFTATVRLRDEAPVQFQLRENEIRLRPLPGKPLNVDYQLSPVTRGEYHFGFAGLLVNSPVGLFQRLMKAAEPAMVKVYPSFLQMRRYELLAISNRLTLSGIKKVRKRGQQSEFDHIREYVPGDDIRAMNWKASARRDKMMLNQFTDERAQQVFSVINLGRTMKMPFAGMTLADYAINSSLALSNIILKKHDRAGLITFDHRIRTFVPAEKKNNQLGIIMESLYNQQSSFPEPSHATLYNFLRYKVTQRSLLFIYTNFETMEGLEREKGFLARIARHHLPVVILFENDELKKIGQSEPEDSEGVYRKVIANKFIHEKKLVVRELNRMGVQTILTTPSGLTVNTINRYLEIKSRGLA